MVASLFDPVIEPIDLTNKEFELFALDKVLKDSKYYLYVGSMAGTYQHQCIITGVSDKFYQVQYIDTFYDEEFISTKWVKKEEIHEIPKINLTKK